MNSIQNIDERPCGENLTRLPRLRKAHREVPSPKERASWLKFQVRLNGLTMLRQRINSLATENKIALPHEPGIVPTLLERVQPVHAIVSVDIYLPGCPPDAERIRAALEPLLMGNQPNLTGEQIRFG